MEAGFERRVFLLTDGGVSDPEAIINLVKKHCNTNKDDKVFTFGIGDGCSRYIVEESAKAGNGDFNFVAQTNIQQLKSIVISSLAKASEPSLKECEFDFGVQRREAKDKILSII
jgi:uncharacterized protein YegL